MEGESVIEVIVYGMPAPQGSKRFVGTTKSGRGLMVESSAKVKPWREAVKYAAREAMQRAGILAPMDGPLVMDVWFTLPKPKSAPKSRVTYPATKPDASKLLRSTEDALTDAGLWADDARVIGGNIWKRYPGEGPGALASPGAVIRVWTMAEWLKECVA